MSKGPWESNNFPTISRELPVWRERLPGEESHWLSKRGVCHLCEVKRLRSSAESGSRWDRRTTIFEKILNIAWRATWGHWFLEPNNPGKSILLAFQMSNSSEFLSGIKATLFPRSPRNKISEYTFPLPFYLISKSWRSYFCMSLSSVPQPHLFPFQSATPHFVQVKMGHR